MYRSSLFSGARSKTLGIQGHRSPWEKKAEGKGEKRRHSSAELCLFLQAKVLAQEMATYIQNPSSHLTKPFWEHPGACFYGDNKSNEVGSIVTIIAYNQQLKFSNPIYIYIAYIYAF